MRPGAIRASGAAPLQPLRVARRRGALRLTTAALLKDLLLSLGFGGPRHVRNLCAVLVKMP